MRAGTRLSVLAATIQEDPRHLPCLPLTIKWYCLVLELMIACWLIDGIFKTGPYAFSKGTSPSVGSGRQQQVARNWRRPLVDAGTDRDSQLRL